jgi:hypothetical protein
VIDFRFLYLEAPSMPGANFPGAAAGLGDTAALLSVIDFRFLYLEAPSMPSCESLKAH